jgi:hypothetical protein
MGQSRTDPLACLACGQAGRFTSPDDVDAGVGSTIICGHCGELHALSVRQVWDRRLGATEWVPYLRRPVLEELEARRADPATAELLQAFELATIERRLAGAARKGPKIGKGLQLVDGGKLKLEGHGPDYRGPHLL